MHSNITRYGIFPQFDPGRGALQVLMIVITIAIIIIIIVIIIKINRTATFKCCLKSHIVTHILSHLCLDFSLYIFTDSCIARQMWLDAGLAVIDCD